MKKRAKAAKRALKTKIREISPIMNEEPAESAFNIEPLPATFTLISILGLIITTVFTVSGRVDLSWGVAFDLVFGLMFVASMVSITPRFPRD